MGSLAYIFPGQGSQAVGMLRDMSESSAIIGETFGEASEVLGYDLWKLVQDDPDEKLGQTEFTQPALLAASTALFRVAVDRGMRLPEVVAGHSLGEYSALVAADVIQFSDALALVQKRGQFMQTAVPVGEGGMAAVLGLDDDVVIEVCENNSTESAIVQAVNFNAPGQVVIAGHQAAVDKAVAALKEAGARRAMPLAVSAPFHSKLMQPAADRMSQELDRITFSSPSVKIIQNVNAEYESDPAKIRTNLVKQMYSAVLWSSIIKKMCDDGLQIAIECGPGKVLSGLNKRIARSITSLNIDSVEALDAALEELAS